MKLSKFAENINQLLKDNPEAGDYDVVTAKDAEGNGYNLVYFDAGLGRFENGDFEPFQPDDGDDAYCSKPEQINAVCVN